MRHARPALPISLASTLALLMSLGAVTACENPERATQTAGARTQPSGAPDLLGAYLEIQTTLADDKLDRVSELSAQVITAADALQGQPGVDVIVTGAGRTAAGDIATARAGFKKMSYGLLTYLAAHPALRDGHEIIFCPMAFNNTGAHWVQKQGDIVNPYHGKMMLHCGDRVAWDAEIKPPA